MPKEAYNHLQRKKRAKKMYTIFMDSSMKFDGRSTKKI